jgi:endonuclease/exonuclease/phosphatase (EEP) superfamily protein YafD
VVDSLHEACEDAEEYLRNLTAEEIAAIVLALAVILSAPGIVAAVVVVARQAIVRKLGSEAAKQIDEAVAAQKPAEPAPAQVATR